MAGAQMADPPAGELLLYLHVPFCHRQCTYCGHYCRLPQREEREAFCRAVVREWALWREEELPATAGPLTAIYIGGGSPGLLGAAALTGLLAELRAGVPWAADCEVTVRVYPDAFDAELGERLAAAGVTRLSVAAHAFDDAALQTMGRAYDGAQARHAVAAARAVAGVQVNLDLGYGIPGVGETTWEQTLREARGVEAEHVSLDRVIPVEESLHERLLRGEMASAPLDEHLLVQYEAGRRFLTGADYEQYAVRRFARPGGRCRYTEATLRRARLCGLGPGAHSFDGLRRGRNAPDLEAYLRALLTEDHAPPRDRFRLEPEHVAQEMLLLGLRGAAGLSWKQLGERLEAAARGRLARRIRVLAEQGFLELEGEWLRLRPQAYFVAERVLRELVRVLVEEEA